MIEVQDCVEDEREEPLRFMSPHGIDAEHDDVAVAECGVDDGGGTRQFITTRQESADKQLLVILMKAMFAI